MVHVKRLGIIVVVMALSVPAYADRGNGPYKHGERAERQGNVDAAYGFYKEAVRLSPNNAKYLAAYTRMRFKAASEHIHSGQLLRGKGALKEALAEFERAVQIDSSDLMAQQELRQTAEMIRQQEKQRATPKVESRLAKMAEQLGEPVELQPISKGPITLSMTADADLVYQDLCKLAGMNVLFDPDYKPQKITIDLNNVTLLQALDMLRLRSKTYWRVISANTILVAADTPAKRKDLEQSVMKTFYLQNVSTPAELQEAANVISKVLDVNRVQLLQSQDALIVRGTMDQLVLAQKLLEEVDKPKSEVVIDVTVMEVNRDRLRTIGATLPTTESFSYLPPGSASSGTGGSSSGSVTIGRWAFSVPSGSFTALASDTNSKILQNPQLRVLNDEKATLRIGDRVPIATGSFAPGLVGAGGVSPLISTQFQYLDVGVNIDITPHIHPDREVTLKMSLEISSVSGVSSIGGLSEPIIGQRRIEHSATLADGEVNLLGGILEDTETQSLSGYPWILKIPLLKYLFGQDNRERRETEIVFAITPHIVRAPVVTDEDVRVVEVGTGSTTELPRREFTPAVSTPQPPATPAKPGPSSPPTPPASAPGSSAPTTPRPTTPHGTPGG